MAKKAPASKKKAAPKASKAKASKLKKTTKGRTAAAPAPEPEFVRRVSAAERKAALERIAAEEGALAPPPTRIPTEEVRPPRPDPEFVRRASAAERKAVVEALAREDVGPFLGRVPLPAWKRPKTDEASAAKGGAAPASAEARKPSRLPPAALDRKEPPVGVSPKRIVLLDTNALMMQFQFHVNIEGELRRIFDFAYEIAVPDSVVTELQELTASTTGKDQQEARMAIELAKNYKTLEAPAEGDAGVLRLAEKLNAIVVTNDKILRARLRAKNIPNVHLRSRAFLTLEGHVSGI